MGTGCTKIKQSSSIGDDYNKNMYEFKKIVGKGGFGRVWKVTDKKTRQVFALKVMDKAKIITKKSVKSVINEKDILSKLSYDHIVNMISAFQDRENLYLLIDYLDAGDLRYYINRKYKFDENQIKFIVRSIMQGLRYLHQNNIIHRDIKPENIILDGKGYCRVTDLGVARHWKIQNSHETSGTPGYMSPQVLLRQNHSFCADYFAVGVIAYELVIGKRPYLGKDRKSIRDQILSKQARIPFQYKGVSEQCIDFINKMIQRHFKKRLGYHGINQIFEHPWLKCSKAEKKLFLSKSFKSPIVPLQVNYHQSLQQFTEPDDVWRENILLLKEPQTQHLFNDYYFSPMMRLRQKQESQIFVQKEDGEQFGLIQQYTRETKSSRIRQSSSFAMSSKKQLS